MPTQAIHQQRESCSVKDSRRFTTALEDKAVVKICMRWSSYTGLRISYRLSSTTFTVFTVFFFYKTKLKNVNLISLTIRQ